MKNMKKTAAAGIALAATAGLVAGPVMMTGQAWAEDHTISVKDADERTSYEVYEIFAVGNVDASGQVSNITWADDKIMTTVCDVLDITSGTTQSEKNASALQAAEKLGALTKEEGYEAGGYVAAGEGTLRQIAEKLAAAGVPATATASTDSAYTSAETGYYLFVSNALANNGADKDAPAHTDPIFMLVNDNVSITPKHSVPTVTKSVTADGITGDFVDAEIGETVTFTLEATLPDNVTSYYAYKLTFNDTLEAGKFEDLTAENANVKIYKNNVADENLVSAGFTVTPSGNTLAVSTTDVAKAGNGFTNKDKVIVTYEAKLKKGADLNLEGAGNDNEVTITYSNNPLGDGEGTSKPDNAKVYSYALELTKVDAVNTSDKLAGATFVLYADVDGVAGEKIAEVTTDENGLANFEGLDQGDYWMAETVAPANHQKVNGGNAFKITVTSDIAANKAPTKISTSDVNVTAGTGAVKGDTTAPKFTIEDPQDLFGLPVTGQSGFAFALIAGGVLVIGASAGIAINRRKNNQED